MPTPLIFALPDDLLVEIAAKLHQDQQLYPPRDRRLKAEWALFRVSQRFQQAILRAHELWTVVEVSLHFSGSMKILQLYLKRSGMHPIWLTLTPLPSSLTIRGLDHITPHLGRISRLDIRAQQLRPLPPDVVPRISRGDLRYKLAFWEALLSTFGGLAAPALRHLSLELADGATNGAFASAVTLFSLGVPLLTHLTITGFTPSIPQADFLKNITHLELWQCKVSDPPSFTEDFEAIISNCPALVSLAVDVRPEEIELGHWLGRTLPLPRLRYLRLWLLDLFEAPALEALTIAHGHARHVRALFAQRPGRSFPVLNTLTFVSVTDLTFVGVTETREAGVMVAPSLHRFPALFALNLIHQHGCVHLVRAFWGPNAQQLWPGLEVLTLCPLTKDVESMSGALAEAGTLPKLRLSAALRAELQQKQAGVEVELFDPVDIMRVSRCS
ncbi:hypothetical protein C8R46DRAFT_1124669 [Mycena filopes]|nr:hypothetical protein C8R46DRAFT_1124669 [Mycena filopes]